MIKPNLVDFEREGGFSMKDFASAWSSKQSGFADRLKDSLAPKKNLKERIAHALRILDRQSKKLDITIRSLKERDKRYFARVVEAIKNHDRVRATIYANELVEIRKALHTLNSAKYAIESVMVRLTTIEDLGDAVAEILPIMQVLKNVRGNLSYILPVTEDSLNQVSNLLQDIVWDATMAETTVDFTTVNEEALKILQEAERKAKEEMEKELPGIPSEIETSRESRSPQYSEFKF